MSAAVFCIEENDDVAFGVLRIGKDMDFKSQTK